LKRKNELAAPARLHLVESNNKSLMDKNPLENIRNSNSIRYVMKNGRLYEGDSLNEIYPRAKPLDASEWKAKQPGSLPGVR
jgi:hypothetical protein